MGTARRAAIAIRLTVHRMKCLSLTPLSPCLGEAMQFHEYLSIRNRWARYGKQPPFRDRARSMKPDEFRKYVQKTCTDQIESGRHNARNEEWFRWQAQASDMEQTWVDIERPSYNIWPIAIPLAQSVRLEVPMKCVVFPFQAILLRFPGGHEPYSIGTAMLLWDTIERFFAVHCHFANSTDGLHGSFGQYDPDETFESRLQRMLGNDFALNDWSDEREASCDTPKALELMVRIAVCVALLSRDEDLITPIILSKDQNRYDETDDTEVKKWLEERAAKKAGKGFDICKKIQLQKELLPHWRNLHLALFWTGPGRTQPIIKMRSGAIIQKVSISEVPTGYFGPETEADDPIPLGKTPRESIGKSQRFRIFKRDGYQCQLCGRSHSDDNVKLHVDHRVPLAKGGSNEDENLWTLCDACNLGKSDKKRVRSCESCGSL